MVAHNAQIEDYNMVQFIPLDATSEDSVGDVLSYIDHALCVCLSGLRDESADLAQAVRRERRTERAEGHGRGRLRRGGLIFPLLKHETRFGTFVIPLH